MDTVFVVVYQEYDDFEVIDVFKNRVSAETYILNFPCGDGYIVDNFHILEKILWE